MKDNNQFKKLYLIIFILLFVVSIGTIISYTVKNYNKNTIDKIVLKYYEDNLHYLNSPKELEITGDNFNKMKKLLKDVKKIEECECEVMEEYILEINDEYNITFDSNRMGWKKIFNDNTSYQVSIPNELYNLVDEIVKEQIEKSSSTNPSLDNYNFKMDSKNKYEIITDMIYKTMLNDGGSYDSIYYQIDLDNDVVIKNEEVFHANLGGIPSTEKKELYRKKLTSYTKYNIKSLINDLLTKEDIRSNDDYSPYRIKTLDNEKDIYNNDSISKIKKILDQIDYVSNKTNNNKDSSDIIKYELQKHHANSEKIFDKKYYINSISELNKFYSISQENLNINEDYLKDNSVFIQTQEVGSGSIQMELSSVTFDNNTVNFVIDKKTPEIGTADMAYWYLIAIIPNDKLTGLDLKDWKKPSEDM